MLKAKGLLHIINGLCREVELLIPTATSSIIIDFWGEVLEFWFEMELKYMEKVLLLHTVCVEVLESAQVPFIENRAVVVSGGFWAPLSFYLFIFCNSFIKYNLIP